MDVITEEVDYLEKEYSPSMWSKRFSTREEVLHHHVFTVTAASEKAVNLIPHKSEIEYGRTLGQKLDIFGTDLPDECPILVYVHGGFWQELSREVSRYAVRPLHAARVKTAVLGYDLCPAVSLPELVHQVHAAARYIFEYAEKLGSRGVYFVGHSAGAHLVAKLLSSSEYLATTPGANLLQGVFLISGIYDLTELINTSVNDALNLTTELALALSPMFKHFYHLRERRIRVYIIAAQNDSPTFKRQSRDFYELLQNSCCLSNLYLEIRDHMDHFDIVESFIKDDNFLRNLLVHDIGKYL